MLGSPAHPAQAKRPQLCRSLSRSMALFRTLVAMSLCQGGMRASAQVPSVLSGGPPVQVNPYVSEPGVPAFSVMPGTANPFTGADSSDGGGSGGSTGDGGGGMVGASDALSTMLGTSWGGTAVANAQALGVNPSALAAMCVLESGCSATSGSGSAQGTFQMQPAAFQAGLTTALAANPALASQIVPGPGGVNDPNTAAIAASGYLMQANQALQKAGVSNPTVAEARAYYNFGPSYGVQVAQADSSQAMSSILPPSWLSQNGITSGETVGQWNASVAAKVGGAASQSIKI